MTSRISVCLAEGAMVGVSVSSTSYLQDIKISGVGVPLTECLQQQDCNGVVNILNVHLLMNHVSDRGIMSIHARWQCWRYRQSRHG